MNSFKRKNCISWHDFFMGVAKLASKRSKDPSTQVGACIVSDDNRILSLGYNGAPRGFNDDDFFWGKEDPDPLKNKYLYVVHAESNAILNFPGSVRELQNSALYVTLFPCNECAKQIAQVGISKVFYDEKKSGDSTSHQASVKILEEAGVLVKSYREETG